MAGYVHKDTKRTTQTQATELAREIRRQQAELAALKEHRDHLETRLAQHRARITEARRELHTAKQTEHQLIQQARDDAAAIIAEAEQRAKVIREVAQYQGTILAERAYDEGWRTTRDHTRAKRRTLSDYAPKGT